MNTLIVEDEAVVARRLCRMVARCLNITPQDVVMKQSLAEARLWLSEQRADVLFLDLNLAGQDGFDLLAEAVAGPQHTIVVSANTDRAMEAFEYGVLDFIGKPFDIERVGKALQRLHANTAPHERLRFLTVRGHKGLERIPIKQIIAIHGAGDYAELELADGRRLLHDKSLTRLAQILPKDFRRIHRSHILRVDQVRHFQCQPGSRYVVELRNGDTLPVGRKRAAELRDWLNSV